VPAAFSYEGATYAEGTAVQVCVVPLESEEFAPPQAGGQGEYAEGLEGVAACRFQECTSFIFGEWAHLFGGWSWCFDIGGVARGIRPSDTAPESALWRVEWILRTVAGANPLSSFAVVPVKAGNRA